MAKPIRPAEMRTRIPAFSVDVVIVNWNSGAYLRECLAALDCSVNAERLNLIVVDNASTDGSTVGITVGRAKLQLIKNADNRGFAKASNEGALMGEAPFLLFLNPDVRVAIGTVEAALAFLDDPSSGEIGIVGVQLVDRGGGNSTLLRSGSGSFYASVTPDVPGSTSSRCYTTSLPDRLGPP